MTGIVYLIPIALLLGLVGLAAFIWTLRSGQFDDLDGAAIRTRLQLAKRTRDLALFNLAIDSKLRGSDVVSLRAERTCSARSDQGDV
jgi:cbb3-type cytochrome oxidase maturation protein